MCTAATGAIGGHCSQCFKPDRKHCGPVQKKPNSDSCVHPETSQSGCSVLSDALRPPCLSLLCFLSVVAHCHSDGMAGDVGCTSLNWGNLSMHWCDLNTYHHVWKCPRRRLFPKTACICQSIKRRVKKLPPKWCSLVQCF